MAHDKNKGNRLDKKYLGQFKNPEVQKKIQATKKRNKLAREAEAKAIQEALDTGFQSAQISDPAVQQTLLDELTTIALNPSSDMKDKKWAIDLLIKNGAFQMSKQTPEASKQKETPVDEAIDFLKSKKKLKVVGEDN